MRRKTYLSAICALAMASLVFADGLPTKFYVWMKGAYTEHVIDAQPLTYADGSITIEDSTYLLADIDSITFTTPVTPTDPEPADTASQAASDTIEVVYEGSSARLSALPQGVTANVQGADVSIVSTITDRELSCVLSGSSTSGSFSYEGSYKMTVRLNGLSLKGSTEEAIHIKCGKRIALELADGTTNSLEDASTDGGQKAAFYTKGHLEISGSGTLNLKGNIKHAISSKEYMLIKKTTGTINVTSAASDGIHAGEYVQINGGTISVKGIKGDGIQAETLTPDDGESIEDNGKLIIKGGTINVACTADSTDCLKADSTIHIKDGNITLTGSTGIMQKGINSDVDVQLDGGTITITMSGAGGKGIKADKRYIQGLEDGSGPTLKVTTSGSATSGTSGGGSFWGPPGGGGGGWPGGGGNPGGGGSTSGGSSAKAIKCQGTAILYGGTTEVYTSTSGAEGLESKTSVDIRGGKHYFKCYDDCINSSGNIYFNGGVTVCYGYGNDAVDSNAGRSGAITIGNGVVMAYTTKGSPEEGFDCDNNSYIVINGTGTAISAGGTQGGGGGWGSSSSSGSIGSASQGYYLSTSTISYTSGRYYTLADASAGNLITYSFEASVSSTLSLFTASGMKSGSSYTVKYSTSAPTDATTAWHGLYLGSTASGTTSTTSFTAK